MKTLFKALTKILIAVLVIWGAVSFYQLNERIAAEQHAAALEQCKKNGFNGWVKLSGDFSVYRCIAATKTIEII